MGNQRYISNIIGYHANDKERCISYVEKGELIISPDTTFLGEGMYFWDNQHNAKGWDKKKKGEYEDTTIVCSRINIDSFLDLTDEDVVNNINNLWSKFSKKTRRSGVYRNDQKEMLGVVLDTLPFVKEFGVRKGNLQYDEHKDPFPMFRHGSKTCLFSASNKIIYMVNDIKFILDREYVNI